MPGRLSRCCFACQPKWVRLVDSVYHKDSENPNPKGQKLNSLTHFACRKPEKLSRIAQHLERRMQRDLYRRRYGHVTVAMETMDRLVKSSQRLEPLVREYLGMVSSLLESQLAELQILGSRSFGQYAEMDKLTPNNLTEYDSLLERFVLMCFNDNAGVRCAGLRGLASMAKKVGNDDLQINLWEQRRAGAVAGAVLHNWYDRLTPGADHIALADDDDNDNNDEDKGGNVDNVASPEDVRVTIGPGDLAKETLEELVLRASSNGIRQLLRAALAQLDAQPRLWRVADGALVAELVAAFVTPFPRPGQAAAVMEELVGHLREAREAGERLWILRAVTSVAGLAAASSIGPAVYGVFKELCRQLEESAAAGDSEQEVSYRREVAAAIARYAEASPDTQKLEIMKYIVSYEAQANWESMGEERRQNLAKALLSTVATVAKSYRTNLIANALPSDLLTQLIRVSESGDAELRITVQRLLQQLLDRRGNAGSFVKVRLLLPPSPRPQLPPPANKQDAKFLRSHAGQLLLAFLLRQLVDPANRVDNCQQVCATVCLLATETNSSACESGLQLCRFCLLAQAAAAAAAAAADDADADDDAAMKLATVTSAASAAVAALFTLACLLLPKAHGLRTHVTEVIDRRQKLAPHLLPGVAFGQRQRCPPTQIDDQLLFSPAAVEKELRAAGYSSSGLTKQFDAVLLLPPKPAVADQSQRTRTNQDTIDNANSRTSFNKHDSQRGSIWSLLPDTGAESKDTAARLTNFTFDDDADIPFETLKRIMNESSEKKQRQLAEEQHELQQLYEEATFNDLLARRRDDQAQDLRNEFDDDGALTSPLSFNCSSDHKLQQQHRRDSVAESPCLGANINEIEFPSLFVH